MAVKTLAVLPFANIGRSEEGDYLSDGLTDELIHVFTKMEGIHVASRTSSFYFKDKQVEVQQVGKHLRVDFVLEGSVRLHRERVRVGVQLTNVQTGFSHWSDVYERELVDLLELQEEIARAVFQKYLHQSSHVFPADHSVVPENDFRAYECFLKGRYFHFQYTMDNFRRALVWYQKAIDLQPEFALAHAGMSYCYMGLGGFINPDYYRQGKDYALKALALDNSLLEPHLSLFYIQLFYERDWKVARTTVLQALEINSRSADAHRAFGLYYLTIGDLEKAIYEHELAVRYSPLDVILIRGLGWVSAFGGQYDKAMREYQRSLELDPTFRPSKEAIGWLYAYQEKWTEAIHWFEAYQEMVGHPLKGWMGAGYAYGRAGRRDQAHNVLKLLEQRKAAFPGEPLALDFAVVFLGLGDLDKALHHLRKSVREKFILTTGTLLSDPVFAPLREKPAFRQLLEEAGLVAKDRKEEAVPAYRDNPLFEIRAETREQLRLLLHQLVYVKAEGNYSRFVYLEGGAVTSTLLRVSLGDAAQQMNHPSIRKCHRSYLVNLDNFCALRGNAKKYELFSEHLPDAVPVSRSLGKSLGRKK